VGHWFERGREGAEAEALDRKLWRGDEEDEGAVRSKAKEKGL